MEQQAQQIDITKLPVVELYRLALEQQKNVTALFAQLQQAQANVAAIEAEIAKRGTETKDLPKEAKSPKNVDKEA